MLKKPREEEAPRKLASYTAKLDDAQMEKLRAICISRNFTPFEVAYTRFAFKSDPARVNVAAYTSGKVVIAGKGTEEFVTMTLEPEVTGAAKLGYDEVLHPDWFESHAGLDESGKGDFFGPVVAATVIADRSTSGNQRAVSRSASSHLGLMSSATTRAASAGAFRPEAITSRRTA